MEMTLLETAQANADFSTLVTAVEAAGLDELLNDPGVDYTVFAPTNAAFAVLGEAVGALLGDVEGLTDVLLYHVVEGSVFAETVVTLTEVTMANGGVVTIEVTDEGVLLNGSALVVTTDIECSNGVIHVIDAVLLPAAPQEFLNLGDSCYTQTERSVDRVSHVDSMRPSRTLSVW